VLGGDLGVAVPSHVARAFISGHARVNELAPHPHYAKNNSGFVSVESSP
jgi:hypothetical protein